MGKNLIQQRRGRGTPTYRSLKHKSKGKTGMVSLTDQIVEGKIIDIVDCPSHSAPLLRVKYEAEEKISIAPEGVKVGDYISTGKSVAVKLGNTLPLSQIPDGTFIYNIEKNPGDGGKFVKSSGGFAKIVSKMADKVIVMLPSKKQKEFKLNCRASIGIVAGGGRPEKPFLKAGNKYYAMKAKNKLYPHVSGVSMNAVDHPFGGSSSSHKGIPTQSGRNDPPGRKVGMLSPRSTGRKKR
ncbi:MAG: 50S ribosomal protein L2 [Candidatus Woesearchaeota archaeon]|jgi:large subunit ribosomal protein L2|nr:50S ribosomal protein L2 [Candidatus Woesearchaeota archaeon]MDP7610669.1 50S ribosomal protein L2 [Candidatus Woesearchaeota archaeon]|tara:strand:+ start:4059 stop:4772 length:714 start_codon:yes stop_codon:yes gene_type:complete